MIKYDFHFNFGYGFLIRPDHVESDKKSVNMDGCVGYACEWEGASDYLIMSRAITNYALSTRNSLTVLSTEVKT